MKLHFSVSALSRRIDLSKIPFKSFPYIYIHRYRVVSVLLLASLHSTAFRMVRKQFS